MGIAVGMTVGEGVGAGVSGGVGVGARVATAGAALDGVGDAAACRAVDGEAAREAVAALVPPSPPQPVTARNATSPKT
jgi:hypothetical protein